MRQDPQGTSDFRLRSQGPCRLGTGLFALPGIPLLYAGDEQAILNDYSYREDPTKRDDSRWVHRIKTDWEHSAKFASQKEITDYVRDLIKIRKSVPMLGGENIAFYDVQDNRVFAFRRDTIHVVINFSDSPARFMIDAWSQDSTDLLSGRVFGNHTAQELEPYEVRWLKENIH